MLGDEGKPESPGCMPCARGLTFFNVSLYTYRHLSLEMRADLICIRSHYLYAHNTDVEVIFDEGNVKYVITEVIRV